MTEHDVLRHLSVLAERYAAGKGGWSADLAADPPTLAEHVAALLEALGVLRRRDDALSTWWFSPVTGRWPAPTTPPVRATSGVHGAATTSSSPEQQLIAESSA